jgi:type VII secretion integral membrane protein EccD
LNANAANDLCRVAIVAGKRSAELALPAHLPLIDLLPTLVTLVDESIAVESTARGVILQRLGEAPLDEERTPATLGLRDGDVLYLRSRDAAMPPLKFDDLIDGVAVRIRELADRWSPSRTRWLFVALAMACLVTGLMILALPGPYLPRAATAGLVAAALLIGAVAGSRALGDRAISIALALSAVPFAGLCGALVPSVSAGGTEPVQTNFLAGAAAMATAAALARIALDDGGPIFFGVAVAGMAVTIGGFLAVVAPVDPTQAAAIVVAVVLLLSPVVPSVAFRLSGMRMPDLPNSVEDINRDIEPIPEPVMIARTAASDRYATAMYLALGLVCGGGLVLLTRPPGWAFPTFSFALSTLLLLRYRMLTSTWQRYAVVIPGVLGYALLVIRFASAASPLIRIAVYAMAMVLVGMTLLTSSQMMVDRRPRPYWGRIAEISESLLALSLLPLGLTVLGVFGMVRGLAG